MSSCQISGIYAVFTIFHRLFAATFFVSVEISAVRILSQRVDNIIFCAIKLRSFGSITQKKKNIIAAA